MRRINVRNHGCGNDRGIALIIVLAVLFVLAMLATTFVTMQSTDMEITRKYSDEVRARMLAQSGVEEAATLLRDILVPEGDFFPEGTPYPAWTYWGNAPDKGTESPNVATLLEDAVIPSLAYQDAIVQDPTDPTLPAKKIMVEGKQVGFSGVLGTSTHGINSDIYKLKVLDCNSQIHLNEGVGQGDKSPATQNLKRILNVLGDVDTVNITGLGTTLIDNRPKSGWKSKYELISVPGMNQEKFDKIKNFVTTNSWVDKSVANPVPLSADVLSAYPIGSSFYRGEPAIYRYGSAGAVRGYDNKWKPFSKPMVFAPPASPKGFDHAIYAMDELNPVYVELTCRAPVNINLAPREVLISVLAGLQGFFVVERRRDAPMGSNPSVSDPKNDGYAWADIAHTFSPADKGVSASGYLYATLPILGPSASGTVVAGTGIRVESIAEEIMACRSKKKSAVTGIDYATVTYGGLFRTWRQFNQFCDGLVGKLFVDDRDFYVDYVGGKEIASKPQKDAAAQAIADVLKANFNPNLHLNELNPDKNFYLHVDKTDLICNSTEFCFTPMGYFEIEALGMVLEPVGSNDSFTATDNKVRGTKELEMIVKLFDAHRETSQADFTPGTLSPKSRAVPTNNGMPIEVGPEISTGGIQKEVNATGYIALPTVGGNDEPIDTNSFAGTPEGAMELDSVIYANFSRDFKARFHNSAKALGNDLLRNDVSNISVSASSWNYTIPKTEADQYSHANSWDFGTPGSNSRREMTKNYNDKSESVMGPYGPGDDPSPQGRFRLVRSFQMPEEGGKNPTLTLTAPSDHRIDGIHSERHSAPAYWIDEGTSWDSMHGVISMWVKPNFAPEMAGKPRIFFSASRWHSTEPDYMNPTPFGLFFFPAHDTAAGVASTSEKLMAAYNKNKIDFGVPDGPNAIGLIRPASLGFGIAFKGQTGYNLDLDDGYYAGDSTVGLNAGVVTPSLNHSYHSDCTYTVTSTTKTWEYGKTYKHGSHWHYGWQWVTRTQTQTKSLATANMLRAHGWVHVVAKWTMIDDLEKNYGWSQQVFVQTGTQGGTWCNNHKTYHGGTPVGYYQSQQKYCWSGTHAFKTDFHTYAGAQPWHWDLYVDGKEMPRTAKGMEELVPHRRPPFSVHSYEVSDDGAITPHRPKGKYVDGTMEVTRYNRVRLYRDEQYDKPVYATRTVIRPVRVFAGYEDYTYYVTIQEKTGETDQTVYEYVQTGMKTEKITITENVKVGENVRTEIQKFWQIVRWEKQWYRDPPGSYKLKQRDVPVYDWVEKEVTIKEPIYEKRTREVTINTPIYEWQKRVIKVATYTYRTEQRTGKTPVYRWEDREFTETYISGYVKDTRQVPYYEDQPYTVTVPTKKWVSVAGAANVVANTIRLGENSTHGFDSLPFPRNWSADATIDEFYLWSKGERNAIGESYLWKGESNVAASLAGCQPRWRHGNHWHNSGPYIPNVHLGGYTVTTGPSVTKALDLYKRGRYYRTDDDEAIFTSAAIDLTKVFPTGKGRTIPPAVIVNNTQVETPQGITPMKGMTGAGYRVIGVSWTWHGEAVDGASGRPLLYDYKDALDPKPLYPEVKVGFVADGQTYGPFTNDAFSAIRTAKGGNLTVDKPEDVKYTVTINSKGDLNTVLLATPYLDDVTLYIAVEPEIVTICWR